MAACWKLADLLVTEFQAHSMGSLYRKILEIVFRYRFPGSSSKFERFWALLTEQFWDWQTSALNSSRLKGKSEIQSDVSLTCFENISKHVGPKTLSAYKTEVLILHRFAASFSFSFILPLILRWVFSFLMRYTLKYINECLSCKIVIYVCLAKFKNLSSV